MPSIHKKTKWNGPLGDVFRRRQSQVMKKSKCWLKSTRNKYNNSISKYNAFKHGKYTDVHKMLGGDFEEYKVLVNTLRKGLEDAMTIYQLQQKENINDNDIKKVEEVIKEYV